MIKTTGSGFEKFIRDEYTTLVEVNDRVFSTSIDVEYEIRAVELGEGTDERIAEVGKERSFEKVSEAVRKVTLEVFAVDESESVQATLFKMGKEILSTEEIVQNIHYSLPNKHYIPVDMKYIHIDNTSPYVIVSIIFQRIFC